MAEPGFDAYDWGGTPTGPLVLSVPHAGREQPAAMLDALRAPPASLRALEDRHVDAVALGARGRRPTLVQRRARAWIDLNRGEDERDPLVDEGAPASRDRSAKLRAGLGLIPRRAAGIAPLWRRRFTGAEVDARIEHDHRPYHAALAAALAAARARFGVAVLVDLHSMPPLGPDGALAVVGDRFGTSAGRRIAACAQATLAAGGIGCALNHPYAGGHVVRRHGDPARGVHALQIELCRSLYLDGSLDGPGSGLARTVAAVAALLDALEEAVAPGGRMLAAE